MRRHHKLLNLLALMLLGFACVPAAFAQTARATWTLRGIVLDSLRSGTPLVGARVRWGDSPEFVVTDSAGRFRIESLPAGPLRTVLAEPWVDSLGLEVVADIVGRPGDVLDVTLIVPSLARMQRVLCGEEQPPSTAVLIGVILGDRSRDAPTVVTQATWWQESTSPGVLPTQMAVVDSAGEENSYVLCGLPRDAQLRLNARAGARTAMLRVVLTEGVVRHDLVLHAGVVRVAGRIVARSGQPLRGAEVMMLADTSARALTGPDGRFVIGEVAAQSDLMLIRHVGSVPVEVELQPTSTKLDLVDIVLEPLPRLQQVRVTASSDAAREDFASRRRRGLGRFIDDSTLATLPRRTLSAISDLALRLATVTVPGETPVIRMKRGAVWCGPRFFVDGQDVGRLDASWQRGEQAAYVELAVRMEIYSAAEAPPKFNDNDGCGAIVIWTR